MTIVQTGHEVEVRFDRPGVYQLICDIDDHLARGQRSSFTVNQQRPSMFGMAPVVLLSPQAQQHHSGSNQVAGVYPLTSITKSVSACVYTHTLPSSPIFANTAFAAISPVL
jgi:hypothetical protein